MKHEVYLLTDLCMWEANKKNQTFYPHAIEVVDEETGAVYFIKSGSRIAFLEGQITPRSTQETYNKTSEKMSRKRQDMPDRKECKGKSRTKHTS